MIKVKYTNTEKYIEKEFGPNLENSEIYIQINVETAKVLDYNDGIYITTLGNVEGSDKYINNDVLYVFVDIDNILKIFDYDINNNGYNYVTQEFDMIGANILRTKSEKEEYLEFMQNSQNLKTYLHKVDKHKKITILSLIIAVLAALYTVYFFVKRDRLGFNKDEDVSKTDENSTNAKEEKQEIKENLNDNQSEVRISLKKEE